MAGLIYLASPYSHNDLNIRISRYVAARTCTIKHIRLGFTLFSPIVYGYNLGAELGDDYKSWQAFNDGMVKASEEVWVLQIPGWRDSLGVEHECKLALDLGKPLHFIEP